MLVSVYESSKVQSYTGGAPGGTNPQQVQIWLSVHWEAGKGATLQDKYSAVTMCSSQDIQPLPPLANANNTNNNQRLVCEFGIRVHR